MELQYFLKVEQCTEFALRKFKLKLGLPLFEDIHTKEKSVGYFIIKMSTLIQILIGNLLAQHLETVKNGNPEKQL